MGCRYPGAPNVEALWDVVRSNRETLTRLTPEQLNDAGVSEALQRHPHYVPVAGVLSGADATDAAALGFSDYEARHIDPQQRLFIECCVEALERAGLGRTIADVRTGIYAGQALPSYLIDQLGDEFHPGGGSDPVSSLSLHCLNAPDHLPLRTAWSLGVTGPAAAIGGTCATSLVAAHTGVSALQRFECDLALVGGVSLRLPMHRGYLAVPDGPFAPDGHTHSYGALAAGTVFTPGAGALLLARLDDAIAMNYPVMAVIAGSAVGNDGPRRAGYTAPSVDGQAHTMQEAIAVAGLTPRDIELVEGHGTGTALGDPIEVAALRKVFGEASTPWCSLGSVKSLIGHTDSAAGAASLMKAVLAVHHGVLPGSPAGEPNAGLALDGSALSLRDDARPWASSSRAASVNGLGIGGVSAHMVVTNAPPTSAAPAPAAQPAPVRHRVVLASAASKAALENKAASYDAVTTDVPGDFAAHATAGTRVHNVRSAAPWGSLRTARVTEAPSQSRRVVAAFTGGGTQFAGMASGLYASSATFRDMTDAIAEAFIAHGIDDPRHIMRDSNADARVAHIGLPALFTTHVALAALTTEWGLTPSVCVGHSVGEYAAAVTAGVMQLGTAIAVVAERSRIMAKLPAGAMAAVTAPLDTVQATCRTIPGVEIAAINSPHETIITGPQHVVATARDHFTRQGIPAHDVGVAVGAHSSLCEPYLDEFAARIAHLDYSPAQARSEFVSCLTGEVVSGAVDTHHWVRHLRQTVRFSDGLRTALDGDAAVVQVGPGMSITTLAKGFAAEGVIHAATAFPAPDVCHDPQASLDAVATAIGEAWTHGVPVDLDAFSPLTTTVDLPHYPWDRTVPALPARLSPEHPAATPTAPTGSAPGGHDPSMRQPFQQITWRGAPMTTPFANLSNGAQGRAAGNAGGDTAADAATWLVLTSDDVALPAVDHVRWSTDKNASHDGVVIVSASSGTAAERTAAWAQHARDLRDIAGDKPVPVVHLTFGAWTLPGDERVAHDVSAERGLMRVLAQEVPGLRWRTLDLPGAQSVTTADWHVLATELRDARQSAASDDIARGDGTFASRHGVRWAMQWEPVTLEHQVPPPGSVVAVTGGFGQVGLRLADCLAGLGCRVALIGRRRPEPGTERAATVDTLTAKHPGLVTTHVADVSDAGVLGDALSKAHAEHGALTHVVHAPTTVDLLPLADLTMDAVEAAQAAKVAGVQSLSRCLADLPGDTPHVLVMSSAAGTIGGFGLGPYVAASTYVDNFAVANGWGVADWDRLRFGTDAEAAAIAEVTMRNAIDVEPALDALLTLLVTTATQPALRHLAVSPTELQTRSMTLDVARSIDTDATSDDAAEFDNDDHATMARIWADCLGRNVTDPDADFFALGGHSLLATKVLAEIDTTWGVRVALSGFVKNSTVRGCSTLVADARPATSTDSAPASAPGEDADITPAAEVAGDSAVWPLNRTQHAYWQGRRRTEHLGGVGCHFYVEYECDNLDVDRYVRAWNVVIARHPMLRAVVSKAGELLVLQPQPTLQPSVLDYSQLDDDARNAQLEKLRGKLSTRVADPSMWPLILPTIVATGPTTHRVMLSVDVLTCDAGSWMMVDAEIKEAYETGEVAAPAPAMTFEQCHRIMEARATTDAAAESREYWAARAATLGGPPAITSRECARGEVPQFTRLTATVPADVWRAAREAEPVSPTAAVLSRYARALHNWSGDDTFSITCTVFDRPSDPASRDVVGEFTSMAIHGVDATHGVSARDIHERLFTDLDHRDVHGLDVLAMRSDAARAQHPSIPVVFTSMLGLNSALPEGHSHQWLGEYVYGASQTPQVWLDHQAFEDRGGLVLQWDVCTTVVDLAHAQRAFDAYVASFGAGAPAVVASAENTTDVRVRAAAVTTPAADVRVEPTTAAVVADEPVSAPVAAESATIVATVWAKHLHCAPEDIGGQSLSELGGDSLLAVRILGDLRRETGIQLPATAVTADSTVADIAAELGGDEGAGQVVRAERRTDPSAEFDLLPLQQAYLVGASGMVVPSYPTAHASIDFGLTGLPTWWQDADEVAARLSTACARLAQRHSALRLRITPRGKQRIQPYDDAVTFVDHFVDDLRGDADAQSALDARRAKLRVTGPNPATGPGVCVGITLLPSGNVRIHLATHLMILDGWSMALFSEELLAALEHPHAVRAPLAIDFGDYVDAVQRLRSGPEFAQQLDYWTSRPGGIPAPPQYLSTQERPADLSDTMTLHSHRLAPEAVDRLMRAATSLSVTPSTLLLTAFADALHAHCGNRFGLSVMHHSRHAVHEDVTSLLGGFAQPLLVEIDAEEGQHLTDRVASVHDALAQSTSRSLVTAIDLARHEATQGRSPHHAPLTVFQSTWGIDSALDADEQGASVLYDVDHAELGESLRTPGVALEMRIAPLATGEVLVSLASVDPLLPEGFAQNALRHTLAAVDAILDGRSTVDVPAALPSVADHPAPEQQGGSCHDEAVARVWADCLPDGATADGTFFEQGGDSLGAISLLGAVRERTGVVVEPRDFLADPTLPALQAHVQARTAANSIDDASSTDTNPVSHVMDVATLASRCVVELKHGGGQPLWLIHPSGGDVLCYLDLARQLPHVGTINAIADPGLADVDVPTSIDDLAAMYADIICHRQETGNIILGGWSMGGTLSHHIARELQRRGRNVAGVFLIDANAPDRIRHLHGDSVSTDRQQELRYLRSLEVFLGFDVGQHDDPATLTEALVACGAIPDPDRLPSRVAVFKRHLVGLADHQAALLEDVPVWLGRATRRSPRNSGEGMGVDDVFSFDLGWSPWATGEMTVHEIDAHHYDIVAAPAISDVVAHLAPWLRRLS